MCDHTAPKLCKNRSDPILNGTVNAVQAITATSPLQRRNICRSVASLTLRTIGSSARASHEPLTPEVAELLRMRPEDNFTPPSVFETWQNQRKRTEYAEWFSDTWQATATYTGTGHPFDGLITFV